MEGGTARPFKACGTLSSGFADAGTTLPLSWISIPLSHCFTITMPPAAGPSQEILEARGTYTFEIPASEHDHQDILLSAPGQTTPPPEYQRDPLSYDADIPSSRNERSKLKTPLDGARPSNLIGRFKNRCRNLTHAPKLSPRENERHSLNRSRYIPVIQIHPKGRAYPLYNLEAKLGERDSYNSIEFQCSGSSSNSSSFRQITLEIQLFHLGNVNSEYHEIVP